jgi:hypothetical protein
MRVQFSAVSVSMAGVTIMALSLVPRILFLLQLGLGSISLRGY